MNNPELIALDRAIRDVLGSAGTTNIKPVGEKWKLIRAVPVQVFEQFEKAYWAWIDSQAQELEAAIDYYNEVKKEKCDQ